MFKQKLQRLHKTSFLSGSHFSTPTLTLFALIFASIGTYFLFFSHASSSLPSDINNDGVVNVSDLSLLLSSYGSSSSACVTAPQYTCDLNGDGSVNIVDLSILLSNFGQTTSTTSIYWGADIGTHINGTQAPWDWTPTTMPSATAFSNLDAGGKQISLVAYGAPWYSTAYCNGYCTFDATNFQNIRSNGVIPVMSWSSQDIESFSNTQYTDAAIVSGSQDSFITAWAQAAKAWGHPFFLRFDWEMNGNWFPWDVGVNGNTSASYIAMWQHVHNIFTSVGVTNVTWLWCPNVDWGSTTIASVYPGDNYVDWTGLDGYNTNQPWTSFQNVFSSSYATIMGLAPAKSMMIPETGSTETGGSKAQWISDMFTALPTDFPNIRGLMWYDDTGAAGDNWIESSSSSEAAFAAGIGSSIYTTNSYSNLNTSPIPAP